MGVGRTYPTLTGAQMPVLLGFHIRYLSCRERVRLAEDGTDAPYG